MGLHQGLQTPELLATPSLKIELALSFLFKRLLAANMKNVGRFYIKVEISNYKTKMSNSGPGSLCSSNLSALNEGCALQGYAASQVPHR